MAEDPDHRIDPPRGAGMSAAMRLSMDEDWAAFLEARQSLAEVMTDDELYEFGFNLQELDRKP